MSAHQTTGTISEMEVIMHCGMNSTWDMEIARTVADAAMYMMNRVISAATSTRW